MAIGQETEGRGIGGFMNKFQRQWDQQRARDAQDDMRRQRERRAEEAKQSQSEGSGGQDKRDNRPVSQRGLNTPSSSIGAPAAGAQVIPFERRENVGVGGSTGHVTHYDSGKAPPYLDAIADKYGINRDDFKRMAFVESGFDPSAHNASGASGLFQFMPGTAREFGLRNVYDGPSNADAAARLWNSNKEYLAKALGREPTGGELYLAHQQGAGGAAKMLANPNAPAASFVGTKAITQNGGHADMTAGQFAGMWTRKFDSTGSQAAADGSTPRNRDAGNPSAPYRVASASTANDASSSSVRPATSTPATTTLPSNPSMAAPDGYYWDLGGAGSKPRLISRATGQDMAGQPVPSAGSSAGTTSATPAATTPSTTTTPATGSAPPAGDVPLPPRRPEMGPPMPEQTATQPAQQAQPQQQSSDAGKGIGGFLDSLFGPPPKDQYGREWDSLYGFEKPPESNARNDNAGSMLNLSSLETAAKSIFSPAESASSSAGGGASASAGGDFSPAFNFFNSLFG